MINLYSMNIIKMHYSIGPSIKIYVKGYGFLSFARNIGKNISRRYSQKLVDTAKKSTTHAIKSASKRAIQTTGDLIGNKIADKITSISKKSAKELHAKKLSTNEANNEIPKKR